MLLGGIVQGRRDHHLVAARRGFDQGKQAAHLGSHFQLEGGNGRIRKLPSHDKCEHHDFHNSRPLY